MCFIYYLFILCLQRDGLLDSCDFLPLMALDCLHTQPVSLHPNHIIMAESTLGPLRPHSQSQHRR